MIFTVSGFQFISSGRLRHFPHIHGELGGVYKTPCVVFTGHPSLRCGDAVHFMEAWGGSNKNCVIFTGKGFGLSIIIASKLYCTSIHVFVCLSEPDFDYLHALAPYQPISMKVCYSNGCLHYTTFTPYLSYSCRHSISPLIHDLTSL